MNALLTGGHGVLLCEKCTPAVILKNDFGAVIPRDSKFFGQHAFNAEDAEVYAKDAEAKMAVLLLCNLCVNPSRPPRLISPSTWKSWEMFS